MPLVKRFEELQAWQQARKLTRAVYTLTQEEAFRRDYGLVDQIRRAAVSVMNNIVEGFESSSPTEFIKFLGYAKRSGSEVQSCLYVALDQNYCSTDTFQQIYDEVEQARSLVTGFIRYLRTSRLDGRVVVSTRARKSRSAQLPRHTGT